MTQYSYLSDIRIFCLLLVLCSLSKCSSVDGSQESAYEDGAPVAPSNSWSLGHILQQNDKRNSWNNFHGSWGKRGEADEEDMQKSDNGGFDLSKRGKWSNLHGTWGKRLYELPDRYLSEETNPLQEIYNDQQQQELNAMPLKRDWAKFAGTWGKRPFGTRTVSPRSTNWSSLRGSWGKRGGDWAQLRGVWGKRTDETF